jgi:hypothetical protein
MAFENGLNAGIILQGADTTHPIQPQNFSDISQQAAQTNLANASAGQATAATGLTQAQTGLVGSQAQGQNLTNLQTSMGLVNAQAMGQAYRKLATGTSGPTTPTGSPSGVSAPTPQPPVPNTAGSAPPASDSGTTGGASGAPSADGSQAPTSPASDSGTTSGASGAPSSGSSNTAPLPPGQRVPNPDGMVADPMTSWWKDAKTGVAIPHSTGPDYAPDGRVNMYSAANINKVFDDAIQTAATNGGNVASLIAAKQTALTNAQEFDEKNGKIQQQTVDIANGKKDLEVKQNALNKSLNDETASNAYKIVTSTDPITMGTTLMAQQPKFWASLGFTQGSDFAKTLPDGTPNPKFALLLQASKTAPQVTTLLGNTKTVAETGAANAAAGASNASAAQTRQTTALTGAKAVVEAAPEVGAIGTNLDKNVQAIGILKNLQQGGQQGGKVFSVLGDLDNLTGNNPQYALLKDYVASGQVQQMLSNLGKSGQLSQSMIDTYSGQLLNKSMPLSTLQTLMEQTGKLLGTQYAAAKEYAGNVATSVGPTISTGTARAAQTAPVPTATQPPPTDAKGVAAPHQFSGTSGASAPAPSYKIGSVITGADGKRYVVTGVGANGQPTGRLF